MYIGPWQEYQSHVRLNRIGDGSRELDAMRESIIDALQKSLDPLSAQRAMDAVHPLLDVPSDRQLGNTQRILAPLSLPSGPRPGVLLSRDAIQRTSRSEPVSLVVKKKKMTSKVSSAHIALPPLSLPPLVDGPYDSATMVSLLRLTRKQDKKAQGKRARQEPIKITSIQNKTDRIKEMQDLFQPRTAMTDSMYDEAHSDVEAPIDVDDLSIVAKYFSSAGTKTSSARPQLSPVRDSEDPLDGSDGLLRWSISLNPSELESL